MTKTRHPLSASELRGLVQLAAQATAGVTRIAEGVHRSVWDSIGVPGGDEPGRTRGISGLVYSSVRSSALLAGRSVSALLEHFEPGPESPGEPTAETPGRLSVLSALNGVLGDHLAATGNPLALPMSLRCRGRALDAPSLPTLELTTGRVLVLLHGLCKNDLQWSPRAGEAGTELGEVLASELGATPVYLRYNSGLHISRNGRELAARLEELIEGWPQPVEELIFVAHSMGGLVARSALHYSQHEGLRWPDRLKTLVFLGTPHHGAPLERLGSWVDGLLGNIPFTAPFARLGRLRSAGITDLRYGHLVDEDWQGRDRFERHPDRRRIVPLPTGVACYTVAATTAATRNPLADHLVGDGLVPLHSALGRHTEEGHTLAFPETSQWIAYRTSHLGLLQSTAVRDQLLRWLAPRADPVT